MGKHANILHEYCSFPNLDQFMSKSQKGLVALLINTLKMYKGQKCQNTNKLHTLQKCKVVEKTIYKSTKVVFCITSCENCACLSLFRGFEKVRSRSAHMKTHRHQERNCSMVSTWPSCDRDTAQQDVPGVELARTSKSDSP